MKKLIVLSCLLLAAVSVQAQFEQGKWIFGTSLTGLDFSRENEHHRTSFGLEVKTGAFLLEDFALIVNVGAQWNQGDLERDIYRVGVGLRYYFDRVGIYVGANGQIYTYQYEDKWKSYGYDDKTRVSFGLDLGYSFFLSRTVTIEPAIYWDIDKSGADYGLKIGFGIYF